MIIFINNCLILHFVIEMKVKAFIDRENKNTNLELGNNSIVSDLLKELNINPVTVIVSRNNELILEDEKLKDNDEIRILSVISGG